MSRKPVMLIILDGWGIRSTEHGNAVAQAHTPNFDRWLQTCERTIVHSSGEHVGLVTGQMGNSEVGHLNLGAGRIVYQDISRIANAIAEGTLADNAILQDALDYLRRSGKKLHLIGLLGSGGVHSHSDHLYALMDIAKAKGINPVHHLITDGRDTPTRNGIMFCRDVMEKITADDNGRVATVSGRYHAMDRDQRWDRTQLAYDAMAFRVSEQNATNALTAIQQSYDSGVTDEFIVPTVIGSDDSLKVESGDVLLSYNFRADRMRQLGASICQTRFRRRRILSPNCRSAIDHDNRIHGRLDGKGVISAGAIAKHAGRNDQQRRKNPVPQRRNGKVSSRNILLQWTQRATFSRRNAQDCAVSASRHL